MYKTVRQGDASLQYTILPQVDQFYDMSSIPGQSVKGAVHCPLEKNFAVPMARRVCLSLLIIAMFVCCAIGAYLFDEMVSRRCAIKTLEASSTNGYTNIDDVHDNEGNEDSTTSMTTADSRSSTSGLSSEIVTSSPIVEKESSTFAIVVTESPQPPAPETHWMSSSSSEAEKTTSSSSSSTSAEFAIPDETSDSRTTITTNPAPTNSIASVLGKLKILKRPRVALELAGITDTVPQMYLNAGIASYKKGKITTTVLAQGLTLEGLMFGTSDGTANPWREKWSVDENKTGQVHRKRTFLLNMQPLALSIWIVMLLVLLVVMLRLVRSSIERHHGCEQTRMENSDEAHSTLLDSQSQDSEDKE